MRTWVDDLRDSMWRQQWMNETTLYSPWLNVAHHYDISYRPIISSLGILTLLFVNEANSDTNVTEWTHIIYTGSIRRIAVSRTHHAQRCARTIPFVKYSSSVLIRTVSLSHTNCTVHTIACMNGRICKVIMSYLHRCYHMHVYRVVIVSIWMLLWLWIKRHCVKWLLHNPRRTSLR